MRALAWWAVTIAGLAACGQRHVSAGRGGVGGPGPPADAGAADANANANANASDAGVERLVRDARALEPVVTSPFAKRFVAAAALLPRVSPRTLHYDATKTRYVTHPAYEALSTQERALYPETTTIDEEGYYSTRYGSPLSYARPFDVLASRGVTLGRGTRLFDFGYGYIGHLRILASLGLDVVGVDVDPMLPALYSEPGDQGFITANGERGRLRILSGRYPNGPGLVGAVGKDFDVIVSKNVLKKGYIHPERPPAKGKPMDLGASDDEVLRAFFNALRPGGHMLVYNICPALTPPDKPFVPWSDGRSPFSKTAWEAAGFTVLAFDQDDVEPVRRMGKIFGWDRDPDSPWDLDHDLSVLYTLAKRS